MADKQEALLELQAIEYMPSWVLSGFDYWRIIIFELLGTALFAFGICVGQFQPPPAPPQPNPYIPNPSSNSFIPIALFFGICFSGRLTGGHLNPAVTLTFVLKKDSDVTIRYGLVYMISQCFGAILGASSAQLFTGASIAPVIKPGLPVFIFQQFVGEAFGTALFTFFILMVTCPDTTIASSNFIRWVLIAVFFYITRTFAYRPGGMNPALAIGMDIFQSAHLDDWSIMNYIWILIVAPFIGAGISSTLFQYLYRPMVVMLKRR